MTRDPALETFLAESAELMASMEGVLLQCEQGSSDPEAVNELFRAAHTIKGSAGLFGLDSIVAFTHVVESVLDRARAGRTPISVALAAILLDCVDHIGKLVAAIGAGGAADEPEITEAGAHVLGRLTAETGFTPKHAPKTAAPAAGPGTATGASPAGPASGSGPCVIADTWHISLRFGADVLRNGMDPLSFLRYLGTFGTIAGLDVVDHGLPPLAEFDPEICYLGFELAFKSSVEKSRIEAAFEFVREDCRLRILAPHCPLAEVTTLLRELGEAQAAARLVRCSTLTQAECDACVAALAAGTSPEAPSAAPELPIPSPPTAGSDPRQNDGRRAKDGKTLDTRSIRVDGDKLDKLIDWIGELIIAGAATGAIARQAGLPVLQESAQQLAHIVSEIRDQALKLRMVQIGSTFSRFQRVVRDVARETGKDIALVVSGAETELDRTLVEGIADPLTHLVRNAIDHGIERPEVRQANDKPVTGTVRLHAFHDAGSVVIEVFDDGGGLKRDRILQKALDRGLIAAGQTLTDEQIFALIFEPGFSTAEQVTNLSGRGVGMDVVKRNITALRGTVEVESAVGRGTCVRIRLPLTLAIIDGFQVGVGRSHFVIPLDLVEQCVEVDPTDASDGSAPGHISLHGTVLPLIRLREVFDIQHTRSRRQSVVVVRNGGKRVGIVVDELLGELQAVIKPLSRLFSQLQGIGGSTILGTGKVALILDVPGLVERTQQLYLRASGGEQPHTREPSVLERSDNPVT